MNGVTGAGRASTSKKGHHGEVYNIYILMLFKSVNKEQKQKMVHRVCCGEREKLLAEKGEK